MCGMIPLIEDRSGHHLESAMSQLAAQLLIDFPQTVERLRTAEKLVVATDWSTSAGMNTAGLLIADLRDLNTWWNGPIKEWRTQFGMGERTYSYKDVPNKDRDLKRMRRFLTLAGDIPGLVLTVSVPTSQKFILSEKNNVRDCPSLEAFKDWAPDTFEAMRRTASLFTVALNAVLTDNRDLIWFCDQDKIIANSQMADQAQVYFVAHLFEATGKEWFVLLHDHVNSKDRLAVEDVLAIPDFAVGGLSDYLGRCLEHHGDHGWERWITAPADIKDKANQIALWFGWPNVKLVRGSITVDNDRGEAGLNIIRVQRSHASSR